MTTEHEVYYKDVGKGTPIVLLHGNPDTADMWDDVIERLSLQYRCIAPDLPGYGRSPISDSFGCTLEEYVSWMDEFIQDIGITEPIHLVVHDLGGPVGLSWASRYPDKVKSMCITNTLYFSDYRWHFWARIWRTPILGELSQLFLPKWLFRREVKIGGPLLSSKHIENAYEHVNPTMKKTVLRMYRAFSPSIFVGWEDDYMKLSKEKPTIVIWGAKDPYIPMSFGFAERMANGQSCHVIPESGHWVAAEVPEQFSQLVLSFYQQQE